MIDRRFLHEHLAHDLSGILDTCIVMCGCGAIGSNLAEGLARRGFRNFVLIDHDRIEEHNISTQIWTAKDVGQLKVHALATKLYAISKAKAVPYAVRIESQADLVKTLKAFSQPAVLVDSFDNQAARAATRGLMNTLHVGMSSEGTAEITWEKDYTLPPDVELEDPCAYPLSRSLIEVTIAHTASILISYLLTGKKVNSRVFAP